MARLLAAVGLYGAVASTVTRKGREIGIRIRTGSTAAVRMIRVE